MPIELQFPRQSSSSDLCLIPSQSQDQMQICAGLLNTLGQENLSSALDLWTQHFLSRSWTSHMEEWRGKLPMRQMEKPKYLGLLVFEAILKECLYLVVQITSELVSTDQTSQDTHPNSECLEIGNHKSENLEKSHSHLEVLKSLLKTTSKQ